MFRPTARMPAALLVWPAIRHRGDLNRPLTHNVETSDPLRMLDQCFAQGEIDEEDYHQRRNIVLRR